MTLDDAIAALANARLRLFRASQRREEVMLRRVRMEAPDTLTLVNTHIAAARDDVQAATAAVQAAMAAAPPPAAPPPDPGSTPRDIALDAVLAARAALTKLE